MCAFSFDAKSSFSLEILRLAAATAGLFSSSALPVAEASEAPAGSPPVKPDAGASAVQGSE